MKVSQKIGVRAGSKSNRKVLEISNETKNCYDLEDVTLKFNIKDVDVQDSDISFELPLQELCNLCLILEDEYIDQNDNEDDTGGFCWDEDVD